MKTRSKYTWRITSSLAPLALIIVLLICLPSPPYPEAEELPSPGVGGATFDLYAMFGEQILAPSRGISSTFYNVDVRNICDSDAHVELSVSCESPFFQVAVHPQTVNPGKGKGSARARVELHCDPQTPEGEVGWTRLVGRRGEEEHRIWLKVTALSSQPKLEFSRGVALTGEGYTDPELQVFTGKALTWKIAATNQGGAEDIYELGYQANFPCQVTFRDRSGRKIDKVKLHGVTRNLLYAKPFELKAEVVPLAELPKNQPQTLSFTLGPGEQSSSVASLEARVMNPGMLFCVNDLSGLRPHPHQVMPGETTSFIFHLSNLDAQTTDIELTLSGQRQDWKVDLERKTIQSLPPGETEQVYLEVTPPKDARVGEILFLDVSAESGTGRRETLQVAVEVTGTRNIYYFSIDSMNPEYLYLNREGTGPGSEGDWLMPNLHAFLESGVNYTNAKCYLPSATDMNHTNALAGTLTGTQGIYMVGGTYARFTEHDEVIARSNSMEQMYYGEEGKPLKRIYEVAKEQTGGKALCGFWSNKDWLANLEGEKTVEIIGNSERWPFFFMPPWKYRAAGDPQSDENPQDRLSASFGDCCMHSNNAEETTIPTMLGQFDLYLAFRFLNMPISLLFGKVPGMHAEDRYIAESFIRSVLEEDPDVCYVNLADLDNTGHFTGASWFLEEWEPGGKKGIENDRSRFSPWPRREECLDILREADLLFGEFIRLLKDRGVYDNSIIVFLSDHGMENAKDPEEGYQFIDLREILRKNGFLHREDYFESGGTEINLIWCDDPTKTELIEKVLEDYTVEDKELGTVHPLCVINRQEMRDGVDYGKFGRVRPRELYSEYWINHPEAREGQRWPNLFVFPLYNYQQAAHGDIFATGNNAVGIKLGIKLAESVIIGMPGTHGGLQTTSIPLIFKAPAGYPLYSGGTEYDGEVEVGDIAPTIYRIMGWPFPENVDGKPLQARGR